MFLNDFLKKIDKATRYRNKIHIIDNASLEEQSKKYIDKLLSHSRVTDTDIVTIPTMKIRTASRELLINRLCEKGPYPVEKCLVLINPYGYVPLSIMAIFNTEEKLSVKAWVECEKDVQIISELPPSNDHKVPIMGLFPASKNYINIELYRGEKRVKRVGFIINTEPLPDDMKYMVRIMKNEGKPAYRFYHVSGVDTWYPYVFDYYGRIRYYITKPSKNYGVFPMSDGILLHADRAVLKASYGVPHSVYTHKMDALGRIRGILCVKNGLHHDAIEISPGGNYLIGTSSLEGYCEDSVAEIDKDTGKLIKRIDMNDIITEPSVKDSADWAHVNTVSYCAEDNTVLVCLRNLHSVLKINWETGKLIWMLGDPYFWENTTMESYVLKPKGDDIRWFYQAHSSFQMPNEDDIDYGHVRIAIYDNHWQSRRQTDNFDEDDGSYGLVYDVNESKGTVSLYRCFDSKKSTVRSNIVYNKDADRMLLMSGCLLESYEKRRALIYDYKYDSNTLVRLYGIKQQFYRAYPFEFNIKSLTEKVEYNDDLYGELEELVEIPHIDVSGAVKLDISDHGKSVTDNSRSKMKTRTEKEAEWDRIMQGKTWEELDHTERINRTRLKKCGNTMFLYAVDHIVSHLYLVSDEHTYVMDYTGTYQELPALFYDYGYSMPIPLHNIKGGKYKVYLKCFDTLYDVDRFITLEL